MSSFQIGVIPKICKTDINPVAHVKLMRIAGRTDMVYFDEFVVRKVIYELRVKCVKFAKESRAKGYGRYMISLLEEFMRTDIDMDSYGCSTSSSNEVEFSKFPNKNISFRRPRASSYIWECVQLNKERIFRTLTHAKKAYTKRSMTFLTSPKMPWIDQGGRTHFCSHSRSSMFFLTRMRLAALFV